MKEIIKEILTKEFKNKKYDTRSLMQRGVGDIVENNISQFLLNYKSDFLVESASSKRSIEDVKISKDGSVYFLDIKTHDIDSDFSMPNLVSIDRLRKCLSKYNNFIVYVFVDYKTTDAITEITDINVLYIEDLSWNILSIANLGKGQLQIKDANKEIKTTAIGRAMWMQTLKENVLVYYDTLLKKIEDEYKKPWL
jgi:hypothetical protein